MMDNKNGRNMKEEDLLKWFQHDLLPGLVKSGRFGDGQTFVRCEFDAREHGVSSFASVSHFVKLVLRSGKDTTVRDVLVKFQPQDEIFRKKMKTMPQFKNETAMYTEVVPGFAEFLVECTGRAELLRELLPKCYFASHEDGNPERSIVILGDLRGEGFRPAESLLELDLNHCLAALKRIAQFHAISFAMKFQGWKPLEKLKESFVEVWLEDEPTSREMCEDFKGRVVLRGIEYLLGKKDSEVPEEYLRNLKKLLGSIFEMLRSLHVPQEPLAVICHGDFNRNNLLFRYPGGQQPPVAVLLDFQTSLYGSPCLDLSFFIYMNTTLEFREKHFEEIFRHYYSVLVRTVSEILGEGEEIVAGRIPIRAFRDDFARVAIHAYATVSFFLPVMAAPLDTSLEEDFQTKTFKEMAEENFKQGGEAVSKRIADVLVDFYRRKFYT